MRKLRLLFTATALLILAACGGNKTLPDPTISSVNPGSVMAEGEITITGTNYYAIEDRANVRIEVCGITTTAELVAPVTRTILLPPGNKITAQVGTGLRATIPADGFTPGLSSIRVIRPDGMSVTLEDAVSCVAPTPVEPEPEEPVTPAAPVITSFTGPTTIELVQAATFTWAITNEDDSGLTCNLNPGDDTAAVTLEDCSEPFKYTYSAAGEFTARLTVQDEDEQSDTATHMVTVTEPEPVIPAGPRVTAFTSPAAAVVGETITFTWVVEYDGPDVLTCTINPGVTTGAQVVACDVGELEHTYSAAGSYPVEFKVADERGQVATAGRLLPVTLPPLPEVVLNVTPVHLEAESVITGPNGFTTTITGSDTISLPGPGEYEVHASSEALQTISVLTPTGGQTDNLRHYWDLETPATTTITVGLGDQPHLNINYELRGHPTRFELHNESTAMNLHSLPYEVVVEKHSLTEAGTWTPFLVVTDENFHSLEPGFYRTRPQPITHPADFYTEIYDAEIGDDFTVESAVSPAEQTSRHVDYYLRTASLTTSVTGLPPELEDKLELDRRPYPTYANIPRPWNELVPGRYRIRADDLPTTRPFTKPPGTINNHDPDEPSEVMIFYRARNQFFSLDSGQHLHFDVEYTLEDEGHLAVLSKDQNGDWVDGNVSIRPYPGGEDAWQTYTGSPHHQFGVEAGVYEVRPEDIPAVPGVHNGYTVHSAPKHPYFVVPAYYFNGVNNHITVEVVYRANP